MKKLLVVLCTGVLCFSASADFTWSWWRERANEDSRGCSIGVSTENKTVTGAQISICISKAQHVTSGCQFAIGYSQVKTLRNGVQLGFFNNAQHAALQFGLICRNEGGFLPWFPFFNFDKSQFGSKK